MKVIMSPTVCNCLFWFKMFSAMVRQPLNGYRLITSVSTFRIRSLPRFCSLSYKFSFCLVWAGHKDALGRWIRWIAPVYTFMIGGRDQVTGRVWRAVRTKITRSWWKWGMLPACWWPFFAVADWLVCMYWWASARGLGVCCVSCWQADRVQSRRLIWIQKQPFASPQQIQIAKCVCVCLPLILYFLLSNWTTSQKSLKWQIVGAIGIRFIQLCLLLNNSYDNKDVRVFR